MTRRIAVWDVPTDDQPHEIGGGPVVHTAADAADVVQVWTDEPYAGRPKRTVRVYGTGVPIELSEPGQLHPVLGTALTIGREALHVVEVDNGWADAR